MLTKTQRWKISFLSEHTELSNRAIAQEVHCSHQAVGDLKRRLGKLGLCCDDIESIPSVELDILLFPNYPFRKSAKVKPDYDELDAKMLADDSYSIYKGWTEYKAENGVNTLEKTRYYDGYRIHRKQSKLAFRKSKKPGEIAYIDYAGKKTYVFSPNSSKAQEAHLFLSNIGRSTRFFFYATPGETTKDWIEASEAMLEYHGGTPQIIVPDNARAVMKQPQKIIQINFEQFAKHYKVAILSTRPYKPKDKGIVENSVSYMYSRVLSDLNQMKFFSFEELNKYLRDRADELNDLLFQKLSVSRNQLFFDHDKPKLGPLPQCKFSYIEAMYSLNTKEDYTVLIKEHFYSVPVEYRNQKVDVHVTAKEVRIYHDMKLIALHPRSFDVGGLTRKQEHLHHNHFWFEDKQLDYWWSWAEKYGPSTQKFMALQFKGQSDKSHLANNDCRAIQEHIQKHDEGTAENIEKACQFALKYQQKTPTHIANILQSKIYLDAELQSKSLVNKHENVRGSDYYSSSNPGESHVH